MARLLGRSSDLLVVTLLEFWPEYFRNEFGHCDVFKCRDYAGQTKNVGVDLNGYIVSFLAGHGVSLGGQQGFPSFQIVEPLAASKNNDIRDLSEKQEFV